MWKQRSAFGFLRAELRYRRADPQIKACGLFRYADGGIGIWLVSALDGCGSWEERLMG